MSTKIYPGLELGANVIKTLKILTYYIIHSQDDSPSKSNNHQKHIKPETPNNLTTPTRPPTPYTESLNIL